jgi:uncharacterized protein YkwD
MRTLINILTILFFVGSTYFAIRTLVPSTRELPMLTSMVTPGPLTKIEQPTTTSTGSTITKPVVIKKPIVPTIPNTKPVSTTPVPSVVTVKPIAPKKDTSFYLLTTQGIIARTNAERAKLSVATVSESAQLDASASIKAEDILARQYFEHTAPDGRNVSNLVGDQGYTYIKIGENLALGDFVSDADVVTAWMNSPGHRANILDPDFKEMGVGVAYGMYKGHNVYVAVQHFGRPSSSCPVVNVDLKAAVEAGQAMLGATASSLQSQKAAIDQGKAQGQDESSAIATYNAGVDKYQSDYALVEALRAKYNDEVVAFNKCVSNTN